MYKPENTHTPATPEAVKLPIEVEIFIEADGTVTFADMAAEVVSIAIELNPDAELACDPNPPSADIPQAETDEHQQPAR